MTGYTTSFITNFAFTSNFQFVSDAEKRRTELDY